jgi:hypothetical protein
VVSNGSNPNASSSRATTNAKLSESSPESTRLRSSVNRASLRRCSVATSSNCVMIAALTDIGFLTSQTIFVGELRLCTEPAIYASSRRHPNICTRINPSTFWARARWIKRDVVNANSPSLRYAIAITLKFSFCCLETSICQLMRSAQNLSIPGKTWNMRRCFKRV